MKSISVCVLLSIFATITNCEKFSSIDELTDLHINQKELLKQLENFIYNLKNDVNKLQSKLNALKEENMEMSDDLEKYVYNPLNAYLLIKSLSYDVENIQSAVQNSVDKFADGIATYKLPESDLAGAVDGFHRLQYTYLLESKDLAKGIIQGKKYRNSLKADDLFVLGKHMQVSNLTYAGEYLELALEENKKNKEVETRNILEELFKCYNESKKYDDAVSVLEQIEETEPENQGLLNRRLDYELNLAFNRTKIEQAKNENICAGTHKTVIKEKYIFAQACRGERLKSAKEQSKLYCFMQSKTPFTKIAPFKVEVVNLDPWAVLFHEIISDKEIAIFKELARPKLARAGVLTTGSNSTISKVRVAKLNWMYDSEHPMFKTLTLRVGDMSGFNMATAEAWQVQNYGIGGHYSLHHDFTHKGQEFNLKTGNRIATTLFYLTDVEKGGSTVFPLLRIHVPARKGTAVYWHNLSSSGDREFLTLHGACPILVGSKWVCNKWLHEYGQENIRPCELSPKPTDENYWEKEYVC